MARRAESKFRRQFHEKSIEKKTYQDEMPETDDGNSRSSALIAVICKVLSSLFAVLCVDFDYLDGVGGEKLADVSFK